MANGGGQGTKQVTKQCLSQHLQEGLKEHFGVLFEFRFFSGHDTSHCLGDSLCHLDTMLFKGGL